jgi:hypothetical protein
MTFKELDLIEPILKALQQTGYTTPTPIQEQAIPVLLKGKDLLGCAQTGTGKTAAFAIPLIQRLYQSDHKKGIKALILTPTRELAIQIGENFDQYAGYTGVKHAVIFGGVPQKAQVDALKRGVQVLIATPGRLLDLQSQGCISLKGLEYFVLDEAATSTTIKLEKGKVYEAPALTCTLLPSAKVGDYYYSDATFSSEKNENKTCIGIVYALDDADGNLSPTLSTSPFGRIVALGDNQSSTKWISKAEDIEGIENYTTADGTLTSGVLPYYNGTADSFFSDKDEERIKGATIHVETGQPATWVSEGAISDFNGKAHTAYLGKSSSSYPAGGYCYQYSTSGKSAGEWYLPSAGELTLLWELQKAGIICKDKQDCFNDFARKAYWSSSEHSAESAWHLNFVSGAIVANSKASNYATRPVAQF